MLSAALTKRVVSHNFRECGRAEESRSEDWILLAHPFDSRNEVVYWPDLAPLILHCSLRKTRFTFHCWTRVLTLHAGCDASSARARAEEKRGGKGAKGERKADSKARSIKPRDIQGARRTPGKQISSQNTARYSFIDRADADRDTHKSRTSHYACEAPTRR